MAVPLITPADLSTPTEVGPDESAPVRIAFRQPVTSSPHIDAAWWPRSRDLAAELPALLDRL